MKRGSREVLLGGPGITRLTHQLVPFLEAGRSPAEVLARVSERDRQQAERVVHELQAGGVVVASSASDANGATADWSVSLDRERLREIAVAVLGRTFIARTLVRGLLELGVGRVVLVDVPGLASPGLPSFPLVGLDTPVAGHGGGRLDVLPGLPPGSELRMFGALCGTSDRGPRDALLDANRLALRLGLPFLPVSLVGTTGHLGPLTIPRRTACLRCALPLSSGDPSKVSGEVPFTAAGGMLGEMAALQLAKFFLRPGRDDLAGRLITMDMCAFTCTHHRVLRVPRCADCSMPSDDRSLFRMLSRKPRLGRAAVRM